MLTIPCLSHSHSVALKPVDIPLILVILIKRSTFQSWRKSLWLQRRTKESADFKISKLSNILVFQFSFSNSAPKRSTILSHNWTSRGPAIASGSGAWKKGFVETCFSFWMLSLNTWHYATLRMRSSFQIPEQTIRVSTKSSLGQNLACHNKSHGSGLYLWICWTWKVGEKSKQSLTLTRAEMICSSSLL